MAIHVVHDRGRGYSNSFTLCRGGTLSPQHSIHPSGTKPRIIILSMRIIHQNLSLTYPSTSTSPYELWPSGHGKPPSGNCIGISSHLDMSLFFWSLFFYCHWRQPRHNPYGTCEREPILKDINFQLSPT